MSYDVKAVLQWLTSEGGLEERLIGEFKGFHIFTEDDLQFSTYYHIRKFFAKDGVDDEEYYRTYNKQYLKNSSYYGKYPDLTIWRNDRRTILIELKQTVGRYVEEEEIVDDVKKLAAIGEDMHLIALYTCGLPKSQGEDRYLRISEEMQLLGNERLIVMRVKVGEAFGVELEKYERHLKQLHSGRKLHA